MEENRFLQPKIPFGQRIILVLFGIFLFFLLLESCLRLGGFILLSIQEHRNLQSIKQKGVYRILCLGESTTQDQYPKFLEQALNQSNIGVHFSVIDKGRGSTTTRAILSQVESYLAEYHPDMVVAMMGINDLGGFIPYEVATTSKTVFLFKSLRIYKLIRLIRLHLLAKAKEAGLYHPNDNRRSFEKDQTYLSGIRLEESSAGFFSTEDAFKKAIELNPRNDSAYTELGRPYLEQGKYPQAEEAFKKAIEFNPRNDNAYTELGRLYHLQDRFPQAEEAFKKAIELNPRNDSAYFELGWFYHTQHKFLQAEDALKKAIELNPRNDSVYTELGRLYHLQDRFPQAEDAFKKAIELNPRNDNAMGAISVLYGELGKPELAKEYAKRAKMLRLEYYPPGTVNNYRKLKEILDQGGIRSVCVQYPMRNVEPLKKIFEKDQGIIFVDNESVFKQALQKASYKEYFVDIFAGDFGHCTEKGNRLLAQNIANAILKEVFKENQGSF